MTEWTLCRRVKRDRSGRVAVVGEFFWRGVTDIAALASCTKIKVLYFTGNDIADISALASCGELRSLWLGTNRITDISSLASCGKPTRFPLRITKSRTFQRLQAARGLPLSAFRATELPRFQARELPEAQSAVPWLEPNHRHLRARTLPATSLRLPSRQPPRRGEHGGDRETTRSTSNG